ncbi:MAG: HEAT repeat domain-containing protein [Coleofasciculus sp. B1-GNL1-01]
MILGDPGSGKSTLLQYLALDLFDGLDEVFDPGKREDVITDIHRFTNDYPDVRVIVTSRVIGYKPQRLRDAQFDYFMLQDLEETQVKEFINRWHDLTFTDQVDKQRKRERLQRAIDTSKAIRELAGNPLLLTMMAILNRNQELPRDRPELYNQASRVLLHQWDVERALVEHQQLEIQTIDYKDKQAMLRRVAYQMQAAEKGLAGNLIAADELEGILTDYLKTLDINNPRAVARVMIKQLRERNFILCFMGADYYAFVHRTFLEYFCAWEYVWQFEKERTISLEELKTEVFGKHWQDESWHEVLRLIVGMIEPKLAGEIIDYLRNQSGEAEKFINVFLATACLNEVRNRSVIASTATQLLNQIKGLIQYDFPYYYEPYEEEAKLVREIRTQAVTAIATTWHDSPDTLPWLKQKAQSDDDSSVQYAAVQELAKGWKDDPDTLPWLKQKAQSDDGVAGRMVAVEEIAKGWKDDPDTLPWLKQKVQSDDDHNVRRVAVKEIAKGWKDDPDILPWLKQKVQSDDYWLLRMVAVKEIAKAWKDDPDTLPWLKQKVQSDDNRFVRSAAVKEIAKGWKDDPDTLPMLKQKVQSDDNGFVRREVLEEIAKSWKDDPDTLPILKQKAQSDDNKYVRYAAVQELAQGWKNEPWLFELLRDRVLNDPFLREENGQDNPRQLAIEILIKQYPNHPQTLPLLRDRSENDPDEQVREFAQNKLAQLENKRS